MALADFAHETPLEQPNRPRTPTTKERMARTQNNSPENPRRVAKAANAGSRANTDASQNAQRNRLSAQQVPNAAQRATQAGRIRQSASQVQRANAKQPNVSTPAPYNRSGYSRSNRSGRGGYGAPQRNAASYGEAPRSSTFPTGASPYPAGAVKKKGGNHIARILVAACACVALILIGYFGMRLILGGDTTSTASTADETMDAAEEVYSTSYTSPYTWTNLDRTNGRYVYSIDGEVLSNLGVDVSENQGLIDWSAVAADGIEFAIVRLGYRGTASGTIALDSYFEQNIDGAAAAGISCGVYFFSQATTVEEAREEADYVVQNLAGRSLEYPVVFDLEADAAGTGTSRTAGMDKETLTACAQAFCTRIQQAGYTAMLYGNGSNLSRFSLKSLDYGIWFAEYGSPIPSIQRDFTMWQYASDGEVAGIDAAVDMNIDLTAAYKRTTGKNTLFGLLS